MIIYLFNQDPNAPKPEDGEPADAVAQVLKDMGYDNLPDMLVDMRATNIRLQGTLDTTVAELKTAQLASLPKPIFDHEAYSQDPEGYQKKYDTKVGEYHDKRRELEDGKPTTPQNNPELDSAIDGLVIAAELKGLDKHVFYGTLKSIANSPEHAGKASTVEGMKALGKLVFAKLDATNADGEPPTPPTHKGTEGRGAAPGNQPRPSKETRTEAEIAKAREGNIQAGNLDGLIEGAWARNAKFLRKGDSGQ